MFERCLYFNINALARAINQVWDDAFRPLGLSPAHAYLMRVVLNSPGIAQKNIAQELGLAPSTVTRFVDTLVTRGLLERRQGEGDNRESAVYPTRSGTALQKDLEATGEVLFKQVRAKLGKDAVNHLVEEVRDMQGKLKGGE